MNADPDPDEMPTTVDVLRYGDEDDNPRYMTVPGDDGTKVVGAHAREEARAKRWRILTVSAVVGLAAVAGYVVDAFLPAFLAAITVMVVATAYERLRTDPVPELVGRNVHAEEALERYDVEGYVAEIFVNETKDHPKS